MRRAEAPQNPSYLVSRLDPASSPYRSIVDTPFEVPKDRIVLSVGIDRLLDGQYTIFLLIDPFRRLGRLNLGAVELDF